MLSLESRIFSTRQSKGRAGFSRISKGYFPDLHSEHGIVLIVPLYWQSPKNLMQREVGVMLLPQELQQVGSLLLRQEWIFAKTMPEDPHWYTLRKGWACDADFGAPGVMAGKFTLDHYDLRSGGEQPRVLPPYAGIANVK